MKPMLASPADLSKINWNENWLASPKLDGIRAIVKDGVVLSRSLKPIPNIYVQSLFSKYEHFDGELIVGDPTATDVFRKTTSGVMSIDGEPDVRFYVFDHTQHPDKPYLDRRGKLLRYGGLFVHLHSQMYIKDLEDLTTYEALCIESGYEGVILRKANAPYKYGRSTMREGWLLKVKRFTDAEFRVIGFEERQHNGNEATTNELGRTKRSSHKAGKTGRGDLGALVLAHSPAPFNCGTGFDDDLRKHIWENQKQYLGKLAKVKFFQVGMMDAPRHPTFLGFRDSIDTGV